VSKKLLSDYPRGVWNCLTCRWFSVPDALPIAPALPVPLLFAGRSVPVSLLGFPPRPGPRRLPALLTAIALPRMSRPKVLLTSFEQTPPGAWPAHQPFASAALLIFGMACRTLGRAQGRSLLPEALPRRGLHSSPGRSRSSGQYEINNSIAQIGFWLGPASPAFSIFFASAADPNDCAAGSGARGGASVGPGPEYNDLARRNGSRHCRDATIAEG
jgi:hypothetical protein